MEVELSAPTPAQILISAPKRRFKLAVHRNRIKRLVREAYRQNKQPLYHHLQTHQKQLVFMLFYAAKNIMPYKEIEGKIIILLQRLIKEHEKTSG